VGTRGPAPRPHLQARGLRPRDLGAEDPSQVDRIIDVFRMALLPEIQEFEGFCSASLLVDRTSGRAAVSVTFDSVDAMQRTRQHGAAVREHGARQASGEISEVAEFDLALAHLRVPEMA
jgi:hypothetical protein